MAGRCRMAARLVAQSVIVAGLVLIGATLAPPPTLVPRHSSDLTISRRVPSSETVGAAPSCATELLAQTAPENVQHSSNTLKSTIAASKEGAPAEASAQPIAGAADVLRDNTAATSAVKTSPADTAAELRTNAAAGPFARVALLLMFNSADYISNIASLERWYSPHFGRIVIYCDIPGSDTPELAAATAVSRGVPQELVRKVTFIHSGVGIAYQGGVTRSDIAGGSYSQVALAHYYAKLRDEGVLESGSGYNAVTGVFFLCDDALLNPRQLSGINASYPFMGAANEAGRQIEGVGQGRDRSWSWWRMEEGIPRMRTAMADPAMIEFAPAGDPAKIEWVSAYSDYVYIPRQFLTNGRLQRCLALLAKLVVFNEIAIPTCVHLCIMPVPEADLVYQPHGRTILWGDERKVMNLAFIEQKLRTDLIIHPVKLGRLNVADRQRLDSLMMKEIPQTEKGAVAQT